MKLTRTTSIIASLILAVLLVWVFLSPDETASAPEVTFKTLTGERIHTSELRGKPLLVTFWSTSCQPCLREIPGLIALYREFHTRGLEIIGVAMDYDPPNHVVETVARLRVPYRISLDIDGRIAQAFDDVRLTPTNYLIAPDGTVIFSKTGELDMAQLRTDILALLPLAQSRS